MFRFMRALTILSIAASFSPSWAISPDRDFSGKWVFDGAASNTRAIPAPQDRFLTIISQDKSIQCSSTRHDGATLQWSYALDGAETRYAFGEEKRSSQVKWEGKALLVNTIISGPQSYTVMDRWTISVDRFVLTMERTVNQGGSEHEGVLRYRREGQPGLPEAPSAAPRPSLTRPPTVTSTENDPPPPPPPAPRPTLALPPAPSAPSEIVVRAGTRIPLSLRNAIDTKHSKEGDRVYLDTLYPVAVNNRIVIPRGSYVSGTLTISKPAGVVKGKGELFIRFDSLIMPNGVTRDFRARLSNADTAHGTVDRKEGTVTGERDKSGEVRRTAEGAGMGAGIGGLAGAAARHPISGAGIGAAAGAAVGLASVLIKHRPDASLPRGTTVEMLLDRDLYYLPSEIPWGR